jgi:hypothetical protein
MNRQVHRRPFWQMRRKKQENLNCSNNQAAFAFRAIANFAIMVVCQT